MYWLLVLKSHISLPKVELVVKYRSERSKRSSVDTRLYASCHRSEYGLTTLEWLLIVAAVAGLAALAVVLVQNVVDETAEGITDNSARGTAAKVAAARISTDVLAEVEDVYNEKRNGNNRTAMSVNELKQIGSDYKAKCERLNITYSDIALNATWRSFSATLASNLATASLKTALAGANYVDRCTIP